MTATESPYQTTEQLLSAYVYDPPARAEIHRRIEACCHSNYELQQDARLMATRLKHSHEDIVDLKRQRLASWLFGGVMFLLLVLR